MNMGNSKPPLLLSELPELAVPAEVAKVLRCSARYVQQQCADGKLDCRLVAGRYLIARDAVADYLKRQTVTPCRNATQEHGSNGAMSAAAGRSSGTTVAPGSAAQRALEAAKKLRGSSPSTSTASTGPAPARVIPLNAR